jgi:hypothetical protein
MPGVLALLAVLVPLAVSAADPADWVSPFTGTAARAADFGTGGGAGNTFPGAVRASSRSRAATRGTTRRSAASA